MITDTELLDFDGLWVEVVMNNGQTITGPLNVTESGLNNGEVTIGVYLLIRGDIESVNRVRNNTPLPTEPKTLLKVIYTDLEDEITNPVLSADGKWYGLNSNGEMVSVSPEDVYDWQ